MERTPWTTLNVWDKRDLLQPQDQNWKSLLYYTYLKKEYVNSMWRGRECVELCEWQAFLFFENQLSACTYSQRTCPSVNLQLFNRGYKVFCPLASPLCSPQRPAPQLPGPIIWHGDESVSRALLCPLWHGLTAVQSQTCPLTAPLALWQHDSADTTDTPRLRRSWEICQACSLHTHWLLLLIY